MMLQRTSIIILVPTLLSIFVHNNFVKAAGCLNSTVQDHLNKLMQDITSHAFATMKSDSIFNSMGHIGEVINEMHDFAMAAMTPGVKTICEVGFNAGSECIQLNVCVYMSYGWKIEGHTLTNHLFMHILICIYAKQVIQQEYSF
jgi:hypothetical protein